MWWCQFIDWLKFETRPSSLLNFGTTDKLGIWYSESDIRNLEFGIWNQDSGISKSIQLKLRNDLLQFNGIFTKETKEKKTSKNDPKFQLFLKQKFSAGL